MREFNFVNIQQDYIIGCFDNEKVFWTVESVRPFMAFDNIDVRFSLICY